MERCSCRYLMYVGLDFVPDSFRVPVRLRNVMTNLSHHVMVRQQWFRSVACVVTSILLYCFCLDVVCIVCILISNNISLHLWLSLNVTLLENLIISRFLLDSECLKVGQITQS